MPVARAATRTAALPTETAVTVTVVLDADTCTNGSDEVAEWTTVLPGASTSNSSFTATLNDSSGFRPRVPRRSPSRRPGSGPPRPSARRRRLPTPT